MPLFILSILIQVALVIHIVKTGRSTTWIWIVVMLPVAGSIAYFVLEVLPGLTQSRAGRSAGKKVQSVLNPNRDINQAANNYAISDTVQNSLRLAEECYSKGMFEDARALFEKCLKGLHADDPDIMLGIAKSDFELGQYAQTRTMLDKLIELNPDFKNQDAHLLYARTLEKLNNVSEALHEYETLHEYYSGPDASYYYGCFLESQNQPDSAKTVFEGILQHAKNAGKHYNSMHKDRLRQVKNKLD